MSRTTAAQRHIVRDFGTCVRVPGGASSSCSTLANGVWTTAKTNVSMGAWFRTSNYKTDRQPIISNGLSAASNTGYALILSGNGTTDGSIYILNHNVVWIDAGFKVQDSSRHHIMLTVDGSGNAVIYLDGISRYTGTPPIGNPSANSNIGNDGAANFFGLIDDARFYSRQLTSTEVLNLYYGIEPSPGPINWYKFDEGSGATASDSGSSAKTATIDGYTYSTDVFMKPRTTAAQRQVVRDFGTCLNFSTSGGTNEVIKTGITGVNYTEFSVSIWLKPFRQTGNSGYCDFWGIEGASASKLVLESNSTFPNVFIISGLAGGDSISTSKNMVSDGLWHNLVYTASKSGNSAVLYLDGVSIGTSVWNPASENITNFTVANRTATDAREASGFYDEAILFSRSLTAAEVTGIYYGTSIPAERILYWKLDEGSGTSATDSSGNSNTGTITGATYSSDVVMLARTTA